jgi:hypothetical protein
MEHKYSCEKCNFFTNAKSTWEMHIKSNKHTGKERSQRCDKKLLDKCPHCDYSINNNICMQQHILNNHSSKKERSEKFTYYCKDCDFGTFTNHIFKSHNDTKKHKRMISDDKK